MGSSRKAQRVAHRQQAVNAREGESRVRHLRTGMVRGRSVEGRGTTTASSEVGQGSESINQLQARVSRYNSRWNNTSATRAEVKNEPNNQYERRALAAEIAEALERGCNWRRRQRQIVQKRRKQQEKHQLQRAERALASLLTTCKQTKQKAGGTWEVIPFCHVGQFRVSVASLMHITVALVDATLPPRGSGRYRELASILFMPRLCAGQYQLIDWVSRES